MNGTNRWLGPAMMGAGAIAIVVAIVGLVSARGDDRAATPMTTTTTTTAAVTTTTGAASTTTTTSAPTTTTTAPATTTTVAAETVEEFVAAFAAALASGDVEFVWARLHPEVIDGYGEELCRAWVEREIMALSDYALVSVDGGPATMTFDLPQGSVTVGDVYDATVRFTLQGQEFSTATDYAVVGAEMHWLGQCR